MLEEYDENIRNKKRKKVRHLAGIVTISGPKLDFNFPWQDALIPIGADYLAVEAAVNNCSIVGCDTIWVIADKTMQPLLKKRMGDCIADPKIDLKAIPIYYIGINEIDRKKRDNLYWNTLVGISLVDELSGKVSRWLKPDNYFISYPYGMVDPSELRVKSNMFKLTRGAFISYKTKTIKNNVLLPFTMNQKDLKLCFNSIKRYELEMYEQNKQDPNYKLTLTAEEIFKRVDFRDSAELKVWRYHRIDTWETYRKYLASDLCDKHIKTEALFKKNIWNCDMDVRRIIEYDQRDINM